MHIQRVDQIGGAFNGNLDQANSFRISKKPVAFYVNPDPILISGFLYQRVKPLIGRDGFCGFVAYDKTTLKYICIIDAYKYNLSRIVRL